MVLVESMYVKSGKMTFRHFYKRAINNEYKDNLSIDRIGVNLWATNQNQLVLAIFLCKNKTP